MHDAVVPRIAALLLVSLLLLAVPAPSAHAAWRWPVRGPVARPYAVTGDRFAPGQHRGVDLRARPGSVVRAACSGRVRFAGRVARLGAVVSVRCGELVATYVELGSVRVRRGERVLAGTGVGVVGAAARLHLGARDVRSGRYVDPLTLLREPEPPALGPAPAPPRPRLPAPTLPPSQPKPAPVAARPAVPPLAWAGLALVAAGLPLGGVVAAQRSRQRRSWTSTSPARRSTSSAR
jgi:murein DD-endopeptidase MepM/ murein hydrolase activator NlpD